MDERQPRQHLQDALSQRWVMLRGRRIDPAETAWLMGPIGHQGVIGDRFVDRIARDGRLVVERDEPDAGLLPAIDALVESPADRARLAPAIADFYQRTARYDLELWSEWAPHFRPFGGLVQRLYSRRLQQLNLPLRPLDAARGVASRVITLRDPADGSVRCTVWHRVLKATGRVVYSGVYATCRTPAGVRCIKVVFPLPNGNATVLMRPTVGPAGELDLVSSGEGFGDSGFYFVLVDRRGRHWAQYIRSFRERITVFVDDEGTLRADHRLTLWRRRVLDLHYRMALRPERRDGAITMHHQDGIDPERSGGRASATRRTDRCEEPDTGETSKRPRSEPIERWEGEGGRVRMPGDARPDDRSPPGAPHG